MNEKELLKLIEKASGPKGLLNLLVKRRADIMYWFKHIGHLSDIYRTFMGVGSAKTGCYCFVDSVNDTVKSLNLNERQVKAVALAKRKGEITNKQYRELFGITDRTALRDINAACEKRVFQRIGVTGRETKYVLTRHKPDINPT
ncbi:MAG: hypothetical protein KJ955_03770 [Nanoarchaeota archaeon]|nr:hypothetical protein [Nanoarchaeota archaeon]